MQNRAHVRGYNPPSKTITVLYFPVSDPVAPATKEIRGFRKQLASHSILFPQIERVAVITPVHSQNHMSKCCLRSHCFQNFIPLVSRTNLFITEFCVTRDLDNYSQNTQRVPLRIPEWF